MNHTRNRLLVAGAACVALSAATLAATHAASAGHGGIRASATIVGAPTAADPAPVVGFARFLEDGRGVVHIHVTAWGLTAGQHGMHIHTTGACTPTFAAAGSHFNPTGAAHGEHSRREHPDHHAGDLPNLDVNRRLVGRANVSSAHFMLSADATKSLFDADGSALVIHAAADDYVTQPTGNSGDRIACGVIVES